MPLLKGTFRPATRVARSRTNSASEGERSRSNSISDLETGSPKVLSTGSKTISNTLVPSQFSAFKVPASPIVVGLSSPHKASPGRSSPHSAPLFHTSPRKTPTTPFSPPKTPFSPPPPRTRLLSPHYIEPPPVSTDEEEEFDDHHEEEDPLTNPTSTMLTPPDSQSSDIFVPSSQSADTTDSNSQSQKALVSDDQSPNDTSPTSVEDIKPNKAKPRLPGNRKTKAPKLQKRDSVPPKIDSVPPKSETIKSDDLVACFAEETVKTAKVEELEMDDKETYPDEDFSDSMSVTSQSSERSQSRRKAAAVPIVIDKSKMTMSDVIKMRPHKRGTDDNPLTEIWQDIKRKRIRDAELDEEKEQSRKDRIKQLMEEAEAMGQTLEEKDIDETELPPIEVEVNPLTGAIVVNERSLEVDMKTETDIRETVVEDEAEISFGKYEDHNVTINSFSRRKPKQNTSWRAPETERFYLALRKVGTDFDLMHKILPEYSRDQLKRKFKREEKMRLGKVDLALSYAMRISDDVILSEPQVVEKDGKKVKKEKVETGKRGKSRNAPESDNDSDVLVCKPLHTKRKSRPLVVDIEEFSVIRDPSLDRKLIL